MSGSVKRLVPESAQSLSAKKRELTEVELELDVDEEEPSAKQRLVGTWNSAEEFGHLGFLSSGIEDQQGDQEKD